MMRTILMVVFILVSFAVVSNDDYIDAVAIESK